MSRASLHDPRCRLLLLAVATTHALFAHPTASSRGRPCRGPSTTSRFGGEDDTDALSGWMDCAPLDDLQWRLVRARLEARHRLKYTRRKPRYLSYEAASQWAQRLAIGRTAQDWRDWLELGEDWSVYVPTSPDIYYGKTGEWVSWANFLCGEEPEAGDASSETLSPAYFERLDYAEYVPWDLLGRPQPAVRRAFLDWPCKTTVLDVGCGAGDNANWLAGRGHRVVGIDINPSAISTAIQRRDSTFQPAIRAAGGSADFLVASALSFDSSEVGERARALRGFQVVLDSGLLHCLSNKDQWRYVGQLGSVVQTGGRVFVGCFSDENPSPWSNPRRISKTRLAELFDTDGWRILDISRTWWQRPVPPSSTPTNEGDAATNRTVGWCLAWWCVVERLGAL